MGPFGDLPDVNGVDHAVDQTERRRAFEAAHPDWRLTCDAKNWTWYAERDLPGGGTERVTYEALRFLLDELERR